MSQHVKSKTCNMNRVFSKWILSKEMNWSYLPTIVGRGLLIQSDVLPMGFLFNQASKKKRTVHRTALRIGLQRFVNYWIACRENTLKNLGYTCSSVRIAFFISFAFQFSWVSLPPKIMYLIIIHSLLQKLKGQVVV